MHRGQILYVKVCTRTDITIDRNVQGTVITSERNVQGTDITSERNVQKSWLQDEDHSDGH